MATRMEREHQLHSDATCQHTRCNKRWQSRLYQNKRNVFLCNDCAGYLIGLRTKSENAADGYVAGSCNEKEIIKVAKEYTVQHPWSRIDKPVRMD